MATTKQKARLGVFLLVGLVLILGGFALVAGIHLFKRYDTYKIRFRETVSGLSPGAAVKLRGVDVGRVEDIKIDPDDIEVVEVKIRVRHGTPILEGAWAQLVTSGITGVKFVDIQGAKKGAARMEAGSYIPSKRSTLSAITGRAETIAFKLEKLLNNALLATTPEHRKLVFDLVRKARDAFKNVSGLSKRLTTTVDQLEPKLDRSLTDFARSARHIRRAATSLKFLVDRTQDDVHGTLAEARETLARLRKMSGRKGALGKSLRTFRRTMEKIQHKLAGPAMDRNMKILGRSLTAMRLLARDLRSLVNRASVDVRPILRSLRNAAENFEEFARSVRENPASLFRPSSSRQRRLPKH